MGIVHLFIHEDEALSPVLRSVGFSSRAFLECCLTPFISNVCLSRGNGSRIDRRLGKISFSLKRNVGPETAERSAIK